MVGEELERDHGEEKEPEQDGQTVGMAAVGGAAAGASAVDAAAAIVDAVAVSSIGGIIAIIVVVVDAWGIRGSASHG